MFDDDGAVPGSEESLEAANPDGEVLPDDLTGGEGEVRENEVAAGDLEVGNKELEEVVGRGLEKVPSAKKGRPAPKLEAASSPSEGGDREARIANAELGEEGEAGPVKGEEAAAAALTEAYRALPGVLPDLISGSTVEEVKQSLAASQKAYADVKAAVLREMGEGVPAARGGAGAPAVPDTPFGKIVAGVRGLRA